jgi:glycosidase
MTWTVKDLFKNYNYFILSALGLILLTGPPDALVAQKKNSDIEDQSLRIDPPFWWSGMQNPELRLFLYGENIGEYIPSLAENVGIDLLRYYCPGNRNYLLLDLVISPKASPGKYIFTLTKDNYIIDFEYILFEKSSEIPSKRIESDDLIYLIMPDRFANGNTTNDENPGMHQGGVNRNAMFERHGGDIEGVIGKLDYLKNLGVSALWLTPVLENNQPEESYHGYAATDLYKVDPRLGNNELYLELAKECHERRMGLIMDVVLNHWGDKNWMYLDLPSESWIHRQDTFSRTNYRAPTLFDPYASSYDKRLFSEGWFDHHMPDLDQKSNDLAVYLIQSHIWWILYAGIDGLRIDTYAYPDQRFMAEWAGAIRKEFPEIFMFGEIWDHGSTTQSWFTDECGISRDFRSNLPSVTDFQLYYAVLEALNKDFGWTEGIARIYYTLAKDILAKNPHRNVTFLDNHDLSRFYSMVGEDFNRFKIGIGILLTTRGIPCIYYGTEILMKNYADPDGKVREDFPGGWPDDQISKFDSTGRTDAEQNAFTFIQKLTHWRMGNLAIRSGKLIHFVPENGVYVYFRVHEDSSVMVVCNPTKKDRYLDPGKFAECLQNFRRADNILDSSKLDLTLPIPAVSGSIGIYELR